VTATLAGVLAAEEVAALGLAAQAGAATLRRGLPLQLCDWVVVATMVALLRRRRPAFELAYFWGLAGTVQALLTPDLTADFPDPAFLTFTGLHATVVVSILVLAGGCNLRPGPRGPLRAWLWLQAYAGAASLANALLGTNYGYLRHKPDHPSLLDMMGPWPWYILVLEAVAFAFFWLLGLPFRTRRSRSETPAEL
jgi:hypothetical integral membrane protein (TIGR02206 family)